MQLLHLLENDIVSLSKKSKPQNADLIFAVVRNMDIGKIDTTVEFTKEHN